MPDPARPRRSTRNNSLVVLGIDPGTLITGYGIVARRGAEIRLVGCGTITNDSGQSMPLRLQKIYHDLSNIIGIYRPDEAAIESAFYGKNAQSALKLGHARGVSILAAVERQIPTSEYSPREVKRAVVGNGSASKEQVQFMIRSLLSLNRASMLHDASDALAVAICHLHRMIAPKAKHKDWKSFILAHPERVKA